MSPLMALRDISLPRSIRVAFGAKRTFDLEVAPGAQLSETKKTLKRGKQEADKTAVCDIRLLLGMTLEEIERQDRAVKKVIRELKAQGRLAKGARQPAQKMRR